MTDRKLTKALASEIANIRAKPLSMGGIAIVYVNDDNRLSVHREHGVYQLRGFSGSCWVAEAYETLNQCRAAMRIVTNSWDHNWGSGNTLTK